MVKNGINRAPRAAPRQRLRFIAHITLLVARISAKANAINGRWQHVDGARVRERRNNGGMGVCGMVRLYARRRVVSRRMASRKTSLISTSAERAHLAAAQACSRRCRDNGQTLSVRTSRHG